MGEDYTSGVAGVKYAERFIHGTGDEQPPLPGDHADTLRYGFFEECLPPGAR